MTETSNIIYVPEDRNLTIYDIYNWKKIEIPVHQMGMRVRPHALEEISDSLRSALDRCRQSDKFAEEAESLTAETEALLKSLAEKSGYAKGQFTINLEQLISPAVAKQWITLSDTPEESFFEEDYETPLQSDTEIEVLETYGNLRVNALDQFDLDLPSHEEEGNPFALDIPRKNSIKISDINASTPLPLIDEFCGAEGVSSSGNTVNIDTFGKVTEDHTFKAPIGRLGKSWYVTLNFYLGIEKKAEVCRSVTLANMPRIVDLLEKSNFEVKGKGDMFRIFERDEDIVHLYIGLPGKESLGATEVPPFVLVARAGGEADPLIRSELLEAILNTRES